MIINSNPSKLAYSHSEIEPFERHHKISLPPFYSSFLKGFSYNNSQGFLNPFEKDCVWGDLGKAFPFSQKTTLLKLDEFISIYKNQSFVIGQVLDLRTFRKWYREKYHALLSRQLLLFGENVVFEGEQFLLELFNAYLISERHFDGSLVVYEYGVGVVALLVLRGKNKGEVWRVDLFNMCFEPVFLENKRANFETFFVHHS